MGRYLVLDYNLHHYSGALYRAAPRIDLRPSTRCGRKPQERILLNNAAALYTCCNPTLFE